MSSGLIKTILQGIIKGKEEISIRRGGFTLLKSEQNWNFPVEVEQRKTKQGEKGFLVRHLWCQMTLLGYGI